MMKRHVENDFVAAPAGATHPGLWFHDRWPAPGHAHALAVEHLARITSRHGQEILVLRHALFGRMLAVDGAVRYIECDTAVAELLVHVPLCGRADRTRNVLVIGGDDGALAREILADTDVIALVVAPSNPDVVDVACDWLGAGPVFGDPRLRLVEPGEQGRRLAMLAPFDLIIVDPFAGDLAASVALDSLLSRSGVIVTAAAVVHAAGHHGVLHHPGWTPRGVEALGAAEHFMIPTALSPGCFVAFRLWCRQQGRTHARQLRPHTARHYNAALHQGAFALPTLWRAGFPDLAASAIPRSLSGTWWQEHTEGTGISQALALRSIVAEQSPFQKIEVLDHPVYGRLLALDDTVQGSIADEAIYHELVVHVPLLGAARPARRVLVVGGGDFGVAREVLRHPEVEEVVMVEIDQRVIDYSNMYYIPAPRDARLTVHVMDAAVYVAAAAAQGETFDCIIIDATDSTEPSMTLWTESFFAGVHACLAEDGVCIDSDILIAGEHRAFLSRELGRGSLTWVRRALARFGAVEGYLSRTPTYPGGYFAYFLYTKNGRSHATPRHAFEGRFYNDSLHRAVFALPTWWRNALAALQPALVEDARGRPDVAEL